MVLIRLAAFALVLFVALMHAPPADALEREAVASCYGYGDGLAGNLTASGEVFDPEAPTVAHRWLPFGTPVLFRVGPFEVLAFVNDRGPGIDGREFDLSCGTMARLGLPPGVYPVMVS